MDQVVYREGRRHRVAWRPMLMAFAGVAVASAIVAAGGTQPLPVGMYFAGMIVQAPVSYRWGWRWGAPAAMLTVAAYWLALGAEGVSDLALVFGLAGTAGLGAATFAMGELGFAGRALYQSSLHDPITKLVNYDFFVMMLHHELARSERHRMPFSLILLEIADLDAFARQRGYRQADIVLREIARLMDGALRESDVLARLGGPAFGLLLPMTPAEGAAVALDWLRNALRSWQPLTAMVGHPIEWYAAVVQYPTDGQTVDDLLSRAETVLNEMRPPDRATLEFQQLMVYARELQQLYRMAKPDVSLPQRNNPQPALMAPTEGRNDERQT